MHACHLNHKNFDYSIKKGNLIYNGSFEQSEPLAGWVANDGVDYFYTPEQITHQGLKAARLGYQNPYAYLYQDIYGVCPGSFYQINCYLTAGTDLSNAPLWITISYLNRNKRELAVALNVIVEQFTLFDKLLHRILKY